MKLAEAKEIAWNIKNQLAPHCERIEIAGSIRRHKPEVGDIEIVCIPKSTVEADFFSTETCRSQDWIRAAYHIGTVIKGHPIDGKYIQFQHSAGINVDLFLATPENWGLILAIRTGSADYSHNVLACGWVKHGYKSIEGMLCKGFHKIPVREERHLFQIAGVPWAEPWNRG
jgi:DNA polymerase/3'-5' exonuclease PolX